MLAAPLALAALTAAPADAASIPTPAAPAIALPEAANSSSALPEPDFALPGAAAEVPAETSITPPAPSRTAASAPIDDIDLAAPKAFPDPLEDINRISYAISQPIDRFILRPAAMVYKAVVPKPGRDGARNAIRNISEPVVFVNDLLQLRPLRALRTLGRFLINTAIGVFGLFDIAKRKPFNLPHRSNSFGSTLGYYGVGPILYLYLPVLGPTTLRDSSAQYVDPLLKDRMLDKALNPNSGRRFFRDSPNLGTAGTVITVVDGLDQRAENDFELRSFKEDSVDPYAALRANFLQDRAGEIAGLRAKDGEAPANDAFADPLVDPEAAAPPAEPAKQR